LPDGRVYVPTASALHRLNPQSGEFDFDPLPVPVSDYWYWRPGQDGNVYLCGSSTRRVLRFDCREDAFADYGTVGHDQGRILARMWEYGEITAEGEVLTPLAVDARCLYLVTGQLPRALWALDLQTREQRQLLCVVDPDRMSLSQREDACYAVIERPSGRETYRLTFDAAVRVECIPPLPEMPRPTLNGIPLPELAKPLRMAVPDYHGTGMCDADGTATVHYRPAGREWRSISYDLGDYRSYLFRMGCTNDGRLLCATDDPYTIFVYDPKLAKAEILGHSPYYTHAYGFAEVGEMMYFAGYTGSPLFEYDPSRPWTYQSPVPDKQTPLPEEESSNPRLVARMPNMRRAYDVLLAADGRLYLPCSAEMTGPVASGGGLGWFNPETREIGMIREGFLYHRGCAATLACEGRYVVTATTAWWSRAIDPETSGVPDRVVTYDVLESKVIGDLCPARDAAAGGVVVEWKPGKAVGRLSCEGNETVFFLLDVASQEIESMRRFPGHSACRLLTLPDESLLLYHDGCVCKLSPADWALEPVARLEVPPRDWRVVEGQVYAFLDTRLVRLVL